MWKIWLLLSGMFIIIEIVNLSFFIFWFGIGALIAMVASFFIDNVVIQSAIFLVSSILLLFATKPFVSKLQSNDTVKTNVYSLEGKTGVVTVDIKPLENLGQIKVEGEVWSATTKDHSDIDKGTKVKILHIEGVKAVVEPITEK